MVSYNVEALCEVLKVSRSAYYDWLDRPTSKREQANQELLIKIKDIHVDSRNIYGYRRVYQALRQKGINCSENRVFRLMNKNNIFAKTKKKFRVTTDSKHNLPIAENLLNRVFKVERPNSHWVGDISYLWTKEGWLYLAIVIDLYSRAVIGWSVDKRMTTNLIEEALLQAIWRRTPQSGLMFHSDRGSQYASESFKRLLRMHQITSSMSRKGNCWDNAVAESFFKTIKTELTYHCSYATKEEAKLSIFEYIEVFYNRKRLHSSIGYMAPMQFEMVAYAS